MSRENSKWLTHKDESIDVMSRGGTIRSSDEASVMEVERRDCIIQFWTAVNLDKSREEPMDRTKPYEISKTIVYEAFQRVKENKGSAGVDDEKHLCIWVRFNKQSL